MGFEMEPLGFSFDATAGEMLRDAASPWAAVLAFESPGVFGASDPVLYVSPHFAGHLPVAMLPLRRRMLAAIDYPASGLGVMRRIAFADPLTEGPGD